MSSNVTREEVLAMNDEIKKAAAYLDWYFEEDDGMADKDAFSAYHIIRAAAISFTKIAEAKFGIEDV